MFLSLAIALALQSPPPPVVELGTTVGGKTTWHLVVRPDGGWSSGPSSGQMNAAELAQLEAAAKAVVLTTTRDVPCPARPESQTLRVARGTVSWAPCVAVADPSVHALVALSESFTTRRPDPMVVKVVRTRTGSKDGAQTVALMRNGSWTTHVGRGTLAPDALAPIIAAFDAALIEAPPIPDAAVCRGDFPHTIEVGGRGTLQFIWPCAKPSPTLAAALDLLYRAVGQTSP